MVWGGSTASTQINGTGLQEELLKDDVPHTILIEVRTDGVKAEPTAG